MAKIIEPPVLMSRILTFVLATSIVVLVALVVALAKMIPLERPEVFFLLSQTPSVSTTIEPMTPDSSNEEALSAYEMGFVREYVIARNTLTDVAQTRKNWTNIIKPWSSEAVYSALTKTQLYTDYTFNDRPPVVSCSVNFSNNAKEQAVLKTKSARSGKSFSEYIVNFTWICENIGGQTTQKNYMIRIRIQSVLDSKMSGTLENLKKLRSNPLGTQVIGYTVISTDNNRDKTDDPLNSEGHF